MSGRKYVIGLIPGDGIGPELVEAAVTVLDAISRHHRLELAYVRLDGGADTYRRTGVVMSPADIEHVRQCDATLKGPVGLPDVRRPDGTEAGLLGGVLRNGHDLYANVRPIRLLPGVQSALQATGKAIDYVIVRENTEGLYASRGKGVGGRNAMSDTLLVTRVGCERIARYAFEVARRRRGAPADGCSRVTLVDKANVLASMYFFRSVFLEVAREYPDVEAECLYVDAAAQALVLRPSDFDVIVTESMFGDILSDLGGGTVGGISLCPGGNVGAVGAYFEPIHGSAPALAGLDRANPISQILAAAMMLDHLGERAAADTVDRAVRSVLATGTVTICADGTPLDGTDATAAAICAEVERVGSTPALT